MSRNRAYTRAQMERRKAAVRRMVRNIWRSDQSDLWIAKQAQNRAICSCPMCGNPRRHWHAGMTTQERRVLGVPSNGW